MSAEQFLPLLRMSIGMQENPKVSEQPVEMDAERKKFLEDAMKNLGKTPVEEMKEFIALLKDKQTSLASPKDKDEAVEEIVNTLENLMDFAENIDLAQDFHKLGGLSVVVGLLDSEEARVRIQAASLLGSLVHNIPDMQKAAFEMEALTKLVQNVQRDLCNCKQVTKSLFGISNLVRNHDAATVAFVKEHKGVALILKVLAPRVVAGDKEQDRSEEILTTHRKAAFLLLYLVQRAPAIVPVMSPTVTPVLAELLFAREGYLDMDLREHLLGVLEVFAKDDKAMKNAAVKEGVQKSLDQTRNALAKLAEEQKTRGEKEDAEDTVEIVQHIDAVLVIVNRS